MSNDDMTWVCKSDVMMTWGRGGDKICLFLMTSFLDSPLYEIKLSFHQYKLSISFSETKSSHFDEDIPLPPYTDRFPHGGMDYQIFVRKYQRYIFVKNVCFFTCFGKIFRLVTNKYTLPPNHFSLNIYFR